MNCGDTSEHMHWETGVLATDHTGGVVLFLFLFLHFRLSEARLWRMSLLLLFSFSCFTMSYGH